MQPYSTPFYFLILGLALIPIVIAQLLGKKLMWYQVLLTIAFLWLTFSGTVTIWALIGFGVFQTIIVKFYEWYRVKQSGAEVVLPVLTGVSRGIWVWSTVVLYMQLYRSLG